MHTLDPAVFAAEPAEHSVHDDDKAAAKDPTGQPEHNMDPAEANVPAEHAEHALKPAAVVKVPETHMVQNEPPAEATIVPA